MAKKTTKRSRALSDKSKNKNTNQKATLTFGLLRQEIDAIIDQHQQTTNQGVEKSIMKELAKILPAGETISQTKHQQHTDIIVQSTTSHQTHSPFVLDLSELIAKKQKEEKKKHLLSLIKKPAKHAHHKAITEATPCGPTILVNHEQKIVLPRIDGKKHQHVYKQFTTAPWYYHLPLPYHWSRTLFLYFVAGLIIIAPIKAFGYYQELKRSQEKILNYAENAYADLKVAGQALLSEDAVGAKRQFQTANKNFLQAGAELDKINSGLKTILNLLPLNQANTADAAYLIEAGENIASIGQTVAKLFTDFQDSNDNPGLRLKTLQNGLQEITPKIQILNNLLNKIQPVAIPENKQAQFQQIKNYLGFISDDLVNLNDLAKSLNEILGFERFKRYLIVFQNNNEIRATGGFMGGFALVDIDRGKITNLQVPGGGTYDLQGSLVVKRTAPQPLRLINPLWELQDANWFPDFPTSARKIKWFYENAGGPTIDGVIAINASFIPALLAITGNIESAQYEKTLTAANFVNELQTITQQEKNTKQPKQILTEIVPKLIDKLLNVRGAKLINVAQVFKNGLNQKDVQLYFTNEVVQEKISSHGWAGEILNTSKDYLAVINTNIGGGKTDAFVEQQLELISNILDNGEIINTLTITRQYQGDANNTFGQTSNLDFVRVYTPSGSQLLEATGFSEVPPEKFAQTEWPEDEYLNMAQGKILTVPESLTQIYNESNKTVFANWLQTDAGETTQAVLKYKLPYRINFDQPNKLKIFSRRDDTGKFFSLLLQKQAGQQNTHWQITINLPADIKANWIFPQDVSNNFDQIKWETDLAEDNILAFTAK